MIEKQLFSLRQVATILDKKPTLLRQELKKRGATVRWSLNEETIERGIVETMLAELDPVLAHRIILFDQVQVLVATWSSRLREWMDLHCPKHITLAYTFVATGMAEELRDGNFDIVFIDTDATETHWHRDTERGIWEAARMCGRPVYGFNRTQEPPTKAFIVDLFEQLTLNAFAHARELMTTQAGG